MTSQTVWYDSGGVVRCVEDGASPAVVHGCEKATNDTTVNGELSLRHTVTVVDGEVTEATYHPKPPSPWPQRIASTRYSHETKGTAFVHSDGTTYGIATDRQSQAMVTGAKVSLDGSTDTLQWKTAQGFVTVDAADMDAIAQAVRSHVQAAFDREAELQAMVADGSITEDDLETGWP